MWSAINYAASWLHITRTCRIQAALGGFDTGWYGLRWAYRLTVSEREVACGARVKVATQYRLSEMTRFGKLSLVAVVKIIVCAVENDMQTCKDEAFERI